MINIGDVVKLKSGGPKMTVYAISSAEYCDIIYCTWFDNDLNVKNGSFRGIHVLVKVQEE